MLLMLPSRRHFNNAYVINKLSTIRVCIYREWSLFVVHFHANKIIRRYLTSQNEEPVSIIDENSKSEFKFTI